MTETQQRFLRAIAERVPVDHVVELHLFPPIRQGGVETGVAVVAEDPRRPLPNAEAPQPLDGELAGVTDATLVADAADDVVGVDAQTTVEVVDAIVVEATASGESDFDHAHADADQEADDVIAAEADDDESPYADDEDDDGVEGEELEDVELEDVELEDAEPVVAESNGHARRMPVSRFTIHTARYRLTLKGIDRGKWEVDVVAEADAPLEAVDAVVRGVQRRAGEGTEPDRLNAEAFRGALVAPLATLER